MASISEDDRGLALTRIALREREEKTVTERLLGTTGSGKSSERIIEERDDREREDVGCHRIRT
jgi:hypothetical protein